MGFPKKFSKENFLKRILRHLSNFSSSQNISDVSLNLVNSFTGLKHSAYWGPGGQDFPHPDSCFFRQLTVGSKYFFSEYFEEWQVDAWAFFSSSGQMLFWPWSFGRLPAISHGCGSVV